MNVANWANTGAMEAENGSAITLNANTFTNPGTLQATSGGTLSVSGLTGSLGTTQVTGANGALLVSGSGYTIDAGLTFDSSIKSLSFAGSYTINISFSLGAGQTLSLAGAWTLPAGLSITVTGATLDLGDQSSLSTNAWTNDGTITATNSTVNLGGLFTLADLGAFTRSGGTVNLTGTLTNSTNLALNNTTGSWQLDGGTVAGGTVTTAGTAELVGTGGGGTLAGVTLAGILDMNNGGLNNSSSKFTVTGGLTLDNVVINMGFSSNMTFAGGSQTLGGTGTVSFFDTSDNSLDVAAGNTLTIGPNIIIRGSVNVIGGSSINEGTIIADNSDGYIGLGGSTWTNEGTIEAINGSVMLLGGYGGNSQTSFTNLGTITGANGFIELSAVLQNAGSNLVLNASTGSWYLTEGGISGGTVTTSGGAELVGSNDGGNFLSGVTLAGTLDLTSASFNQASVTIMNGLTLNQGSINLAGSRSVDFPGYRDFGRHGNRDPEQHK